MRSLSLATVFSALSGFLVLIIAGRALGVEGYESFQAFWGLFFAITGLIDGLMHETTRGTSAVKAGAPAANARPWRTATAIALVVAIAAALASPFWVPWLISDGTGATALMTIGLLSYTYQALLSGLLSGSHLWPRYASLLALDAGSRLVISVASWYLGWGLTGFAVATVIGAVSWISVFRRSIAGARVDVSGAVYVRRVLSAMAASGSTAALVTGFPVMLKIFGDAPTLTGVTISAVMAAVTFTRAPILVPLTRFQSALIVRFVDDRSMRALFMPIGLVLAVGVVGALAAWAIGPWLMVTIYGDPGFWVPGPFLAVLTFASAWMGSLMITGAAALASEKHGLYVIGWVVASVVAFAVLALPLPLEVVVSAALIAGPLSGGIIHTLALRGAGRGTAHVRTF